jgi:hypothetical protein
MAELCGKVGEVRMTVEITRKETGKVETYDIIGFLDEDQLKEVQNGSNAQHSGA